MDDLRLSFVPNQIFALLGHNGAGKVKSDWIETLIVAEALHGTMILFQIVNDSSHSSLFF